MTSFFECSSPHGHICPTRSAYRQRISRIRFGDVVDAEIVAEYGPGFGGVGGVGGGSPVVLGDDEAGEHWSLVNGLRGGLQYVSLVEEGGVIVLHAVGEALHFVAVGHSPSAGGGTVSEAALTAGEVVDGGDGGGPGLVDAIGLLQPDQAS